MHLDCHGKPAFQLTLQFWHSPGWGPRLHDRGPQRSHAKHVSHGREFDPSYSNCKVPIVAWQISFYTLLFCLRLALYFYCISTRLVKCALMSLLYVLLPCLTVMTIVGTIFWARMKATEFSCVSDILYWHFSTSILKLLLHGPSYWIWL